LFQDYNQPGVPGASVMIIQDGNVPLAKGYGLANLEEKTPCEIWTNFRLASVTKQFTAMSALILVERKQLSLGEPLTSFFPEFPAYGRQITVRQLLTHTSGLARLRRTIPKGPVPVMRSRRVAPAVAAGQDLLPARQQVPLQQLRLLLARADRRGALRQTFARFLQSTSSGRQDGSHLGLRQGSSVRMPNRAYGYSPDAGGFKRTDQSLTSSVLRRRRHLLLG